MGEERRVCGVEAPTCFVTRASSPSTEEQTQEHRLATFVLRVHKFSAVATLKIAIVTSFASCGSLVEASSLVPRFVSVFCHFRWIASSAQLTVVTTW